ncbi:MAG: PTS sugar transporter subunit IIA [Thermodesulfobacteriota bacterium]
MLKKVSGAALLLLWATAAMASESAGTGAGMTHRMMMLAIQLGLILFAAKLGNFLLEKIGLPGVLGELAAGILIGPYLLGAVALPGFPHGLIPLQEGFPVSPELYGICSLAAIVLLFMVGLETDIKLFIRYSIAGSLVGIGGVIVSFVLGDLVAVIFSGMLFGQSLGFFAPPCLFLGIMSTATSVGITARILSEKQKLDSPEGVTILAGAVIDDVLGIIMLAVGLGVIAASASTGRVDWTSIGIIAGKAVGIWLSATIIGLLVSRKISVLLKWFGSRASIAIMALGLALILAGLFEQAGLAMIIGAYIMGLSLSKTDVSHVVRENLEPIFHLLVPVFFTVMGMLVNVRLLASANVLIFGLLYTAVAILAKIVGGGMPALLCNFNLRGAMRIGFGMLPRGEVALIIAGIGLSAGILSPDVFGVGVMMTLITTLAAPPLLVKLFENPAPGIRRQVEEPRDAELSFTFPSPRTAELVVSNLLKVFEYEGFFVHVLNHREQIYHIRRDDIIIGFQQKKHVIDFDCNEKQVPFINTAMYEVLAELEQTIQELKKPIDSAAIGRKLQEQRVAVSEDFGMGKCLSEGVLEPDLKGTTKWEIIEELMQILARSGKVGDLEKARKAVLQREESMSTGMQYGIAIPHGRTDAVDRLVCAVGLKRDGVDFDSIDGHPARIFVLTLSPKSAMAPHIQFMATVSQALNDEGRMLLLDCRTPAEMYAVLSGKRPPLKPKRGFAAGLERKAVKAENRLSQYLSRELVSVDLMGTTRTAVIDELLVMLTRRGKVKDPAQARAALLEREELMPTGIQNGIAIPHARTDAVAELVCAVGIQKKGVDFGAIDNKPSRIFVMLLSPRETPGPQLQVMAMISRVLNQASERMLAAESNEELWRIFAAD